MTISVIIPVFQAEGFVKNAVQSACEQKEVSEVILIEDGSTDNSLSICEDLTKIYSPLIKLHRHNDSENHGVAASRNLGIKKASGEFIAFLDADDYYLDDRFTHDLELLQSDSSIDGVYNALGVHVYDERERKRVNQNLTTVKYPIPQDKLFEEMAPIGKGGYFSGDALTVRRNVFDKVGLFDETLEISEDTQMWVKMAALLSLVPGVIDSPVAMRGVHSENTIKDKAKFDYYRPLLFLSLLKWAEENKIPINRKLLIWEELYKAYHYKVSAQRKSVILKKIQFSLFLVRHGISSPYLMKHRKSLFLNIFKKQL